VGICREYIQRSAQSYRWFINEDNQKGWYKYYFFSRSNLTCTLSNQSTPANCVYTDRYIIDNGPQCSYKAVVEALRLGLVRCITSKQAFQNYFHALMMVNLKIHIVVWLLLRRTVILFGMSNLAFVKESIG
jgi:hypothetical protein